MIGRRAMMGAAGNAGGGGVPVKSVVLDIADNLGDATWLALRRIEFKNGGSLLALTASDFTAYVTSGDSYKNNIFDTTVSKTGSWGSGWISGGGKTNQRLIVVFDSDQTFDEIVVNNAHHNGGLTNRGSNNVKITVSPDSISDTTYNAAVSNGTVVFDDVFAEHVASDAADDQTLTLI